MTLLDVIIVLVIAIGIWRGFTSGIVREVAGVLGVLIAFAMGIYLMDPAGLILTAVLGISDTIAALAGFVVVFLIVLLTIYLSGQLVHYIVGALRLGPLNRILGGVLGAFKAALVLSVIFLLTAPMGYPSEQSRTTSSLYSPVEILAPVTWHLVTDTWPDVQHFTERFGRQVNRELLSQGED